MLVLATAAASVVLATFVFTDLIHEPTSPQKPHSEACRTLVD